MRAARNAGQPGADDRGVVLLAAVLVLLGLAGLGLATMSIATQDIQGYHALRENAVARHLAEAGVELVRQWFHDPVAIAKSGLTAQQAALFAPQYETAQGGASFFDEQGRSQFRGSSAAPDLIVDAAHPAEERRLNDPHTGWFRSLREAGRIVRLKLYGPFHPGLLCTVEVTAETGRLRHTVSVQVGVRTVPALRAAVQTGPMLTRTTSPGTLPSRVHWGDVKWTGDAQLAPGSRLPGKSLMTPITGQSYAQMSAPEDRWLDVLVGGTLMLPGPAGLLLGTLTHVRDRQDPVPGLDLDRWDYDTMKRLALREGTYYARGPDGRVYRPGGRPAGGQAADEAVRSLELGDQRGLVFIDTLDGQAPRQDNLGTLTLEPDYMEGLFMINAHVLLRPRGAGRAVPALSPPKEGGTGRQGRVPVSLSHIHLNGVLYTTGRLQLESPMGVFGAVVTEGDLVLKPSQAKGSDLLEVWYNYDLHDGFPPGFPRVALVPVTRQEW